MLSKYNIIHMMDVAPRDSHGPLPERASALLKRRKFTSKAKFESSISCYGFKRLVPGAFNVGFIESTCTALPCRTA